MHVSELDIRVQEYLGGADGDFAGAFGIQPEHWAVLTFRRCYCRTLKLSRHWFAHRHRGWATPSADALSGKRSGWSSGCRGPFRGGHPRDSTDFGQDRINNMLGQVTVFSPG